VVDHPAPAVARVITVRVDNQDFYDVDVYILNGESVVRHLGQVTGNSSATFTLRGAGSLGSQIALYARAIGSGTVYRSGPTDIIPGLGLQWKLGPQRGVEFLIAGRAN